MRSAPAARLVEAHETVDEGLAGHGLHLRIEGRADQQAALVEGFLAVALGDVAADALGEIARGDAVRRNHARLDVERLLLGRRRVLVRDIAVGGHALDHPVPALDGGLALAEGVVVVRALGQGGDVSGLGDGQFVDRLAEIVERRGGDAVQVAAGRQGAEEDLVEIELEDLVLGEGRFHPQRDQRLADLALVAALVADEEVLGDLLRDRRGALLAGTAGAEIDHDGAHETLGIDARMPVEILVLGGEESLDHELGHGLDRHVEPALAGIFGDQAAVRGVDAGHHRGLVIGELGVIRQILRIEPESIGQPYGADQEEDRSDAEEEAEKSQDKAHPKVFHDGAYGARLCRS